VTITESFINRHVNHYLVIKMTDKDKALLEEIKRIKKKQKGLYQEYEIPGLEETKDVD